MVMATAVIEAKEKRLARMADKIAALDEEIEDTESEIRSFEDQIDELEVQARNLKMKRDELKKGFSVSDATFCLPTPLKQRGYKLVEIMAKIPNNQIQITLFPMGGPEGLYRFNVLEDCCGRVVKQWDGLVSLTEVMEMR